MRGLMKMAVAVLIFITSSGTSRAANEPTNPSTGLVVSVACNQFVLNWTNGNGAGRVVVMSTSSITSSNMPTDGTGYTAGAAYGTGTQIGNAYVVYAGSASTTTVTGLISGQQYYVAVFEYNGAGNGLNYLISSYPTATASGVGVSGSPAVSKSILCYGDTATLFGNFSNGLTYYWTSSNDTSLHTAITRNVIIRPSPASTTTSSVFSYSVSVQANNGCISSFPIAVTVAPPPAISSFGYPSVCPNSTPIPLNHESPSGGVYTGPVVNGQSVVRSTTSNPYNFFPYNSDTVPVQYRITYTYSGPVTVSGTTLSCTNIVPINITVYPTPVVNFEAPKFCAGQGSVMMTGGSPQYGLYQSPYITNNIFNTALSGAGTFPVIYYFQNNNGCANRDTDLVHVNTPPFVDLFPLDSVCLFEKDTLLNDVDPPGGYFYGEALPDSASGVFYSALADTGNSWVYYRYKDPSTECIAVDSSVMYVRPLPVLTLPDLPGRCMKTGPLQLNGATPAGGVYYGTRVVNDTYYSQIRYTGTTLPSATVIDTIRYRYTDPATTCTNRTFTTIEIWPQPDVRIQPSDTSIYLNETLLLDAGFPGSTYLWNTGATTQTIQVDTTGRGYGVFSISVRVTDTNGCFNRDTITVTILNAVGLNPLSVHQPIYNSYPNPFTEKALLDVPVAMSLYIIDEQGRVLSMQALKKGVNEIGSELPQGNYIGRLVYGNEHATFRFIRQ